MAAATHGAQPIHLDLLVRATAALAPVVNPLPDEFVGEDNASSAKPRSAVD
ncbi:MAG: hypothetical protein IPK58_15245 [Acidobacteria bacterium]|nr:hypothetical protein [Acidobacteriota bacterium]